MDEASRLHSEIRDRLGVLPNFFRLAPEVPSITTNLWAFAQFGYLDNPLPALFKERLFVSLSRFCEVRYCISRHVGFLIGLGHPSGDARARPETVEQTVALLRRSLAQGDDLADLLQRIPDSALTSAQAPEPGSPVEQAVFDAAAHVFLQTAQSPACLAALTRCFDPAMLQHLLLFLTFVRTAHFWTVVHPELAVEDDIEDVLSLQEELAACVATQPQPLNPSLQNLLDEQQALRTERRLRMELERANAHLRQERERLQVTLASIGDGVLTTDLHGHVVQLNAVAELLTGWTSEEAVGRPIEEVFRIINETTRATVVNPAVLALSTGTVQALSNHTLLVARDGTARPIDDSAAPIRGPDGSVSGCVLIFRDVTERREKHDMAQRLAAIVDSSDDAIISKSLDGVIRTWNAAAERLFGYTAAEAVGRHITMLIPPELVAEEHTIIARIKAGERVAHFDTARMRRDGSRVEVSLTVSPVRDEEGNVIGASKTARDITDRRQTEEELRKAAEAVVEADRRKDRFLAILSHELRNPLSPIRSCLELLKIGQSREQAELLTIMDRQVNQMVRLIDDLLDISRISQGRVELRMARTDIHKVIGQAIESIQPQIELEGQSIVVDIPAAPLELEADAARLTQVLANLLNNAAKASPPGGVITLAALPGDAQVAIAVTDQGIGIPADQLDSIFDMFSQVEGASRNTQGLGIGLTMARELVELHGGRLTVHSEGLGKGATFTVSLPITSAPVSTRSHAPQSPPPGATAATGVKVLVVDDSRDSANSLSMLLKLRGCEVRTEFNGRDALRTAQAFVPRLVFLDIGMPGMSGWETAEAIRNTVWSQDMLLVALSGWGQAVDQAKSRQAGFDEHLIKPADLADLERILAQVAG